MAVLLLKSFSIRRTCWNAGSEYKRIHKGLPVVPAAAYIMRNGRLEPEWADVTRRTMSIASRAIATLISVSGQNDIQEMYNTTQDDGIGFNLAYIRSDFDQVPPKPFLITHKLQPISGVGRA